MPQTAWPPWAVMWTLAATIYAGSYVDVGEGTEEAYTGFNLYPSKAVEDAEKLLAEIERRERAEAQR